MINISIFYLYLLYRKMGIKNKNKAHFVLKKLKFDILSRYLKFKKINICEFT